MYFSSGPMPVHKSIRRAMKGMAQPCRYLVIILATLAAAPALAEPQIPLTLAEAEDRALLSEPGQQALIARATALSDRSVVAGELPDPMLRVGLNNFPIQSGGFTTEGMTHAAVGFRQAFPAGDSRKISMRRYERLAGEMQQQAQARGRNILTATREAWLELFYWQQAHELVLTSRPFFDDLATVTRSLYAVGRKSQQDVAVWMIESLISSGRSPAQKRRSVSGSGIRHRDPSRINYRAGNRFLNYSHYKPPCSSIRLCWPRTHRSRHEPLISNWQTSDQNRAGHSMLDTAIATVRCQPESRDLISSRSV
jgi:hypothetical protein